MPATVNVGTVFAAGFPVAVFLTNSTPAKSASLGFVQLSFTRLCPGVPVGTATAGAVLSPAMVVLELVLSVLRTPITLTARTAARYALPTISPLKVTFVIWLPTFWLVVVIQFPLRFICKSISYSPINAAAEDVQVASALVNNEPSS